MATRCNIAIFEKPNTDGVSEVKVIYSHWDGYPDGVGKTLMEHYTDIEKIRKLINLGDVSSLREKIDIPDGVEHSFDTPKTDITIFYGRDRGESGTEPSVKYMRGTDTLKNIKYNEYLYVYLVEQGKWVIY
jgi:hypothetical protein